MSTSEFFILVGVLIVGLGILMFFRQRAQLAQAAIAIGIVTDLIPVRAEGEYVVSKGEEGTKIERKCRYRPEIRFKTHAGRTIDFVAPIATRPSRYAIHKLMVAGRRPEGARAKRDKDIMQARALFEAVPADYLQDAIDDANARGRSWRLDLAKGMKLARL